MEWIVKLCWSLLALAHATPAAALFAPHLIEKLYRADLSGDGGLLLVHRAALFLAVVVVCLYAALDPSARRAASLVVGISVVSFLALYGLNGFPEGPLRKIALVDAIALLPLGIVALSAWSPVAR